MAVSLSNLERVGELDGDDEPYRWNVFTVFQRKTDGALFYGTDAGCSCNYPWMDDEGDLETLTPETWAAFDEALDDWLKPESDRLKAEGVKLKRDVSKLLGW